MATAYDRGSAFERKMMASLEKHGWYVTRSAGSKGCADLVALDMSGAHRAPILVQCKRTKDAVAPAEWNRLLEVATATGAVPILAVAVFQGARVVRNVWTRILFPKVIGKPVREETLGQPWSPSPPHAAAERINNGVPAVPEAKPECRFGCAVGCDTGCPEWKVPIRTVHSEHVRVVKDRDNYHGVEESRSCSVCGHTYLWHMNPGLRCEIPGQRPGLVYGCVCQSFIPVPPSEQGPRERRIRPV